MYTVQGGYAYANKSLPYSHVLLSTPPPSSGAHCTNTNQGSCVYKFASSQLFLIYLFITFFKVIFLLFFLHNLVSSLSVSLALISPVTALSQREK